MYVHMYIHMYIHVYIHAHVHTRGLQVECVSPPVGQHRQLTRSLLGDESREVARHHHGAREDQVAGLEQSFVAIALDGPPK